MMIQAVLGNPHHPEYGVATIPFPIPRDQHAHCMELLEALEIGDAVKADCKVEKIDSYYIRALKQLGIAVIFEKENINSLGEDSELRITLSGAFAQSESESISANVTWGKRRAMEAGKVSIQYKKLYGYRKGEDGQPEIIPEQAEIVRWLYERYLTGASLRMIKDELEQ